MPGIRTILFPTDFSDFSNKAFPYAAQLARVFGAKIVMLHVAELEEEDPANPEHSFPALDEYAGTIETERVIVRGHAPYKDILDVSRARGCDLIVMATHGRSALSQFFLGGSVAEDVARFSRIPVLIAKIEPDLAAESYTGNLKEILFATDFSEPSLGAYPLARELADRFGATLFTLHVIDDDCRNEFYKAKGIDCDAPDFREKVEQMLRSQFLALSGSSDDSTFFVGEGVAEDEIVKFADLRDIDLIVLSPHGRTGVREEILGTTTDRVIRRSQCPVLTVRT
jgi:nucleotide-binding universal stress UspA family protein